MLLENSTIVSLQLSGNEFDDHAAKYLADAITANSKVEILDLSYNRFGDKAGKVPSVYLAYRRMLQKLPPTLSVMDTGLKMEKLNFCSPMPHPVQSQIHVLPPHTWLCFFVKNPPCSLHLLLYNHVSSHISPDVVPLKILHVFFGSQERKQP